MQSGLCCQFINGSVLWQLLVIKGSPCRGGGGGLPVGGGPQSQSVKGCYDRRVEEAPCLYTSVSSVSRHTPGITSGGSDALC